MRPFLFFCSIILCPFFSFSQPCQLPVLLNTGINLSQGGSVATNVLQNDTNASVSLDTVTVILAPAHGSAVVSNDTITYTGSPAYFGPDSLQYSVCNACGCDTATLLFSIRTAWPIALTDNYSLFPGMSGSVNVLANDSNVNAATDTLRIFSAPVHGTASVSSNQIAYTADAGYVGADTLQYAVCNTFSCDTAFLFLNIKPVPVARPDYFTVNQEQGATFDVKANDLNLDGASLYICDTAKHGGLAEANGSLNYSPRDDYPFDPINSTGENGLDSFCYSVCVPSDAGVFCVQSKGYVTVIPKLRFVIPQGFSPNGDGVNDKFVITSLDEYPKSLLLIYNRWGDEVWRNDGPPYNNDFDGNYKKNALALEDGTYYYTFKFNDGIQKDAIGFFIINR